MMKGLVLVMNKPIMFTVSISRSVFRFIIPLVFYLILVGGAEAATLQVQPATGVYQIGNIFTVRVMVNTAGASVNAAEGTLSFNPSELTVVSTDRSGSIFSLWVSEPTFSNVAGTVNFSGGVPSGYVGTGQVFSITFRAVSAGSPRLSFSNGSVLANDGRGSNVISGMSGGTFTIQAASSVPRPEVVQYVAPANTPAAPVVRSSTHQPQIWSSSTRAILNWELPPGVTGVRTLLDDRPSSIPTRVYDDPIRSITLDDLSDGISYFHIQFRNAEGWGRVTSLPLRIDTERPRITAVSVREEVETWRTRQTLDVIVSEDVSAIDSYLIQLPDNTKVKLVPNEDGSITLPELMPGVHTIVIEVFDAAGNSDRFSFTIKIDSIAPPVFVGVPSQIGETLIPVFRGKSIPGTHIKASLTMIGGGVQVMEAQTNESGVFDVVPSGPLSRGVYELSAIAIDDDGAVSLPSETVRFLVQPAGYIRVGMIAVSVLSVLVPLVGLSLLLIVSIWYMIFYLKRLKRRVFKESSESISVIEKEFTQLKESVAEMKLSLANAKRSKQLTEAEKQTIIDFEAKLAESERRVRKEAVDVEKVVTINERGSDKNK
jgi:hypothetical protein